MVKLQHQKFKLFKKVHDGLIQAEDGGQSHLKETNPSQPQNPPHLPSELLEALSWRRKSTTIFLL